ncbi:hypothetical protein [Nocardia asteroides]|uniref:hypothetical protein n=1 Tax=Nocardia asteroides TaxID=1824 RepID=UPI001E37BFAE|nr:hypothetical protein [Nocardia asteroides]UGT52686.1 hypothetical protein LTT85_18360 [Nocardia asteroides]
MPTPQLTARLRGGGCGVLVGALAVAAHGIAGGAVPGSADLTLLLAVSLAAGTIAGGFSRRAEPSVNARGRLDPSGVPARIIGAISSPLPRPAIALLSGQWASHYALSWSPGHHDGVDGFAHLPGAPMIAAHVLAAFACAALILVAERLYLAASGVVRALLRRPCPLVASRVSRWAGARLTVPVRRPKGARSPRAPPLFA